MNQEFVKLLAERSDEVEKFLTGIKQVRDETRGKVQRLETLIDLKDHRNIQPFPWQPNPNHHSVYLLQYRVHLDDESYVVVQPALSPSGWEIQLFHRVSPKARNRLELERLLNGHEIPPENEPFIHPERFAYNYEDLERIAAAVREELSRIAAIVQEISSRTSCSAG